MTPAAPTGRLTRVLDDPAETTANHQPPPPPGPRVYVLGVVLGAAVGAVAGVYLLVVRLLRELVWDGSQPRLTAGLSVGVATIVTCTLGGLVVGVVRARHDRDSPHDLDDVLFRLDEAMVEDARVEPGDPVEPGGPVEDDLAAPPPAPASGGPPEPVTRPARRRLIPERRPRPRQSVQDPRWILRATLLGIVSLTAGASLGPEAPLLALAGGFGRRIAGLLRLSSSEAIALSTSGALSGLFGGPLGAAVLPLERPRQGVTAPRLLGPGLVAAVAGFAALQLVLPGEGGVTYDLPESGTGPAATVGWALGGGLLGALAAVVLLVLIAPSRRAAERVRSTVLRAGAGGLVLGACAAFQPLVLFSGEHEAETLIDTLGTWAFTALLGLLALKILATVACMATGFFGGQIFPGAFVGMAGGLLLLAVLPAAPGPAVLAAGAGAGTTVLLRRPVASALIMLLFFPLHSALALLLGAAVGAVVVSVLADHLPEATGLGGH